MSTAMLLDDKADLSERHGVADIGGGAGAKVNVFRRWALMRHWHVQNNISFSACSIRPTPTSCIRATGARSDFPEALCDAIRRASRRRTAAA